MTGIATFPELSELIDWPVGQLLAAADRWRATADRWDNAFIQAWQDSNTIDWHGFGAEAARQRTATDKSLVAAACDRLEAAAKVARAGAGELAAQSRQVRYAVEDAWRAGFDVTEDGEVVDRYRGPDPQLRLARQGEAAGLATRIREQAVRLVALDEDIAARIVDLTAGIDAVPFSQGSRAAEPAGLDPSDAETVGTQSAVFRSLDASPGLVGPDSPRPAAPNSLDPGLGSGPLDSGSAIDALARGPVPLTPQEQAEVATWSQFSVANGGGDCSRWSLASALATRFGVRDGPTGREINLPPGVQKAMMGGLPLHFPPTKAEINQIAVSQGAAVSSFGANGGFPAGPAEMAGQLRGLGLTSTSFVDNNVPAVVDQLTKDLRAGRIAVVNGATAPGGGHFVSITGITHGPHGETLFLVNDSNRAGNGAANGGTLPYACNRDQLIRFLQNRVSAGVPGYTTLG